MSAAGWARIRYRVGQFWRVLTARVAVEEVERSLCDVLGPAAQRLFRRQPMADQAHALAVYRMLQAAGEGSPHLLAAALLHDAGKADAGLGAVHRSVVVLLEHWAPGLLARLSRAQGPGASTWRWPFIRHTRHAALGAEWARETGCSPLTVALIARHHERLAAVDSEEDRLLAALQEADRAC